MISTIPTRRTRPWPSGLTAKARGPTRGRAFEAAARFTPTTSTLVNLGVCYMRMASASAHRARKVELYGLSRDAMRRGGELVQDDEDQRLYGENWGHLMTNFEIEHVPFDQEEVLEADPQMCGAPPSSK